MIKIAIGSDHRGFILKQEIIPYLKKKGMLVTDVGAYSRQSCDYPEFAVKVGRLVSKRKARFGILVCSSGLGMAIAANKIQGIRAANCFNIISARFAREHNDANILVLGAKFVDKNLAKRIVNIWLKTKFLGGRHKRRIKLISQE